MDRLRDAIRIAIDRSVLSRALFSCAIVGGILTLINHGDALVGGSMTPLVPWQIALTFAVPFVVSTISSVAAIRGQTASTSHDHHLLQREIAAIDKFPDQNPNPVLRMDRDGHLVYANQASLAIRSTLGAEVGEMLPADVVDELSDAADDSPPRAVEFRSGERTFSVLPVLVPEFDFLNLYGTDITAAKVVDKFPSLNPHPVFRTSADGTLVYANAASEPIIRALGLAPGDELPSDLRDRLIAACDSRSTEPIEIRGEGHVYALRPVLIPEFGFTNVYGTDVTALKAIDKFPDQNPNPVLRVSRDGRLLYANPASALVRAGLGVEVGDPMPAEVFQSILPLLEAPPPATLEVRADGRIFELLVVSVYEFDFINMYGTDVTAAREVAQAHRENERLLLNILPAPIAQRLRQGEMVIADRFDEMTVLFADVVEFTRLSTRLTASEVVDTLNGIFSVFDDLADRYGLEKIKTIGDAYMVVGGLDPDHPDHADRVARMGLDMIDAVSRLDSRSAPELQIRVGMHVGPAVAGVIGIKKFIYDVWGDTVNTASRMESSGVPGRLQVSEETYRRLRGAFVFEPRGTIEVKGKGEMSTYLLVSARTDAAMAPLVP